MLVHLPVAAHPPAIRLEHLHPAEESPVLQGSVHVALRLARLQDGGVGNVIDGLILKELMLAVQQ